MVEERRGTSEDDEEEGWSPTGLGSESQALRRRRGILSRCKSFEGIVVGRLTLILAHAWFFGD